jgi:hypothetical protein
MIARPLESAECIIRGRFSESRCIHKQRKSTRVMLAEKSPALTTVNSVLAPRIDSAYSSGSVKLRTALDGILYPSTFSDDVYHCVLITKMPRESAL